LAGCGYGRGPANSGGSSVQVAIPGAAIRSVRTRLRWFEQPISFCHRTFHTHHGQPRPRLDQPPLEMGL